MTYFLLRDYNILPKKELHWSPWVPTMMTEAPAPPAQARHSGPSWGAFRVAGHGPALPLGPEAGGGGRAMRAVPKARWGK